MELAILSAFFTFRSFRRSVSSWAPSTMSDLEKQPSRHSTRSAGAVAPLAPVKSRDWIPVNKRTLENKPSDVDPVIWLEESSVIGIKERKVRGGG
jgi:hypothetical protein